MYTFPDGFRGNNQIRMVEEDQARENHLCCHDANGPQSENNSCELPKVISQMKVE